MESNRVSGSSKRPSVWLNAIVALLLLYLFLVGITALGGGIKALGMGTMDAYFTADMNPFLGLVIGILATTLVQSSSVTTSLIVGLVGAGQIAVAAAVPMVMGANIGTTVTNTVASLAHSRQDGEFRRAFAAATCHDFFNYLSVLVLLPLELLTRQLFGRGFLESVGGTIAEWTAGASGGTYNSPFKSALTAGTELIKGAIESLGAEGQTAKVLLAVAGGVLILVSLTLIVKVMRGPVVHRLERYVNRFLGSGGVVAMVVGAILTVLAQSSSITTSIMVPLAGAGVVTLAQIYPITLGANIGTTVTALIASMAVSGETATAARHIALVHLLFNLAGILVWYVPQRLREVPLRLATWMGGFAAERKRWAVVYVLGIFYGLPTLLVFISEML